MSARREPFWGSYLILLVGMCVFISFVRSIEGTKSLWWVAFMAASYLSIFVGAARSIYRDRVA